MKKTNNEMRTLMEYEAPTIEIVEVMVEQGFAASGPTSPSEDGDGEDGGDW